MASFMRHVVKHLAQSTGKRCSVNSFQPHFTAPACHLYTDAASGIDNYVRTRERIQMQFSGMADKFKAKMEEYAESETGMVFTEDLKNIVHLIEKESPKDLNLVIKMMKKFAKQNKELRFGSYIFGPPVMRMFAYLNEPIAAFEAFKDPELDGFFDQLISFQILMDLLYKNGYYKEVLEAFEIIVEKQIQDAKYPRNAVVLALAACYQMNSEESLKYAMNLWNELQKVGHVPLRRAMTFAAGLALKQNSPHYALEIISSTQHQNYVTLKNLKILALAGLGRSEEVLSLLRGILLVDNPESRKRSVSESVLTAAKSCIESSNNKELIHEFEQVAKRLVDQGHVEGSLEELLCAEIDSLRPRTLPKEQRFLAASYTRDRPAQNWPRVRPGLADMQ